jgi:hypothetical protein
MHSDERLDQLGTEAQQRWQAMGGSPGAIELAAERAEYELPARAVSAISAT